MINDLVIFQQLFFVSFVKTLSIKLLDLSPILGDKVILEQQIPLTTKLSKCSLK